MLFFFDDTIKGVVVVVRSQQLCSRLDVAVGVENCRCLPGRWFDAASGSLGRIAVELNTCPRRLSTATGSSDGWRAAALWCQCSSNRNHLAGLCAIVNA